MDRRRIDVELDYLPPEDLAQPLPRTFTRSESVMAYQINADKTQITGTLYSKRVQETNTGSAIVATATFNSATPHPITAYSALVDIATASSAPQVLKFTGIHEVISNGVSETFGSGLFGFVDLAASIVRDNVTKISFMTVSLDRYATRAVHVVEYWQ